MFAALVLFVVLIFNCNCQESKDTVQILALRNSDDDASNRFFRSAEVFGYNYHVIDLAVDGATIDDVKNEVKLSKLKRYLDAIHSQSEIVPKYTLVLDSHSSILTASPADLVKQADELKSEFIFIADNYTSVGKLPAAESIFTGFLGKTTSLNAAIPEVPDDLTKDYMEAFQNTLTRIQEVLKVSITVDSESQLFQLISKNTVDFLDIRFEGDRGYLQNEEKHTNPIIAVTLPETKIKFNSICNYLARSWSPETGCQICDEDKLDLSLLSKDKYPLIQLSIFVEQPTPFLEVFFENIAKLSYPKNRIHVTTHCTVPEQKKYVEQFLANETSDYASVEVLDDKTWPQETVAFKQAMSLCLKNVNCEYLFYVDASAQFTQPDAIEHLVSTNRSIVTPLMTRRGKYWSTFWGDINDDGSYLRSSDYFDIVERVKVGLWNVPFVTSTFLMSRSSVNKLALILGDEPYLYNSIAYAAIESNVFLFVDNRKYVGHLVNTENYNLTNLHNDLWQIFDNPLDWQERYINPQYHHFAKNTTKMSDFEQPCTDVFWVPLMSELFCKQLIEEVEHFGKWSDGTNFDPRLEGGYENVPTRDIHMRQIDWEDHWMHVLRTYVYPIQIKLFEGYTDKPWARMNFVVRYRPDEQASLRFHHDASSYTLDMALNRAHIDYQGGGVHYSRYNCSLVDTRVGWPLIFPGRLTHLHEGLETKAGTRYIFVTFVNP